MEQTDQSNRVQDSCPDCHALVADLDAHKRWHSRLTADIARAVDQQSRRRTAADG